MDRITAKGKTRRDMETWVEASINVVLDRMEEDGMTNDIDMAFVLRNAVEMSLLARRMSR